MHDALWYNFEKLAISIKMPWNKGDEAPSTKINDPNACVLSHRGGCEGNIRRDNPFQIPVCENHKETVRGYNRLTAATDGTLCEKDDCVNPKDPESDRHCTAHHDDEHENCVSLGEGAQVPVRCSCGETWYGAHEDYHFPDGAFAKLKPPPRHCQTCDRARAEQEIINAT